MNKKFISCLAFYFLINSTTPCYTKEKENKYFYNKINITHILKEPFSIYNSFRKDGLFKIIDNVNDLHKKYINELNKNPYSNLFKVEEIYPLKISRHFGKYWYSKINYDYRTRTIKFGLRVNF